MLAMLTGDAARALEEWLTRAKDGVVGLVFVDLIESLNLNHDQGTDDYGHFLKAYRARAYRLAADLNGHIVSREGDEIFAVFTPVEAYIFARGMFEDAGHPSISTRAGIHVGSVKYDDAALIGRAIGVTQRVMKQGGPHQFWMSDTARQAIETIDPAFAAGIPWLEHKTATLKGVPEPQVLWRVA